MIAQLISLSHEDNFHKHLKKGLLDDNRTIIYQYLKPKMGGFIDEDSIGISILSSEVLAKNHLTIKCSVFYIERIGGCNCLDEPHAENGYCEMLFEWNTNGLTLLKTLHN